MNDTQFMTNSAASAKARCAIVQIEAVHEITIPFLIHTLNLQGWSPVVYINERCKLERGDIFEFCDNLDFELNYLPINNKQDWHNLEATIKADTKIEFIVSNTFQLPNIAKFVSNFNLPVLGLVHNPDIFLSSPEMCEFAANSNTYLMTLWDHVSNSLRVGLNHRASNITTLKQTYLVSNSNASTNLFSSSNQTRVAITGAIDTRIRGLDDLFELASIKLDSNAPRLKFIICGGGRDRESFELEVNKRGLADWFEFLALDETTGNVPYEPYFNALKSCDFIDTMLPKDQRMYLEKKITSGILTAVSLGIPLIMDSATASVYQLPCLVSHDSPKENIKQIVENATPGNIHTLRNNLVDARRVFEKQNMDSMSRAIKQLLGTDMNAGNTTDSSQSDFLSFCHSTIKQSSSQRFQDLFAIYQSKFKKKGYFVEFGALNGHDVSNSWLLEKLGWDGIVAEPHPGYTDILQNNRNCNVSTDCVFGTTGKEIVFKAVKGRPALSTISMDMPEDSAEQNGRRDAYSEFKLTTISLVDLLKKYNAPTDIDFLSIDTEGSEYEILKNFDFGQYKIKMVCVEHNFTEHRELLFKLFTENGYVRKWEAVSGHDDWYVLAEHATDSMITPQDIDWVQTKPAVNHEERRSSVLAGIYLDVGQADKSAELAERSLALSPGYNEAKAILTKAAASAKASAFVSQPKSPEFANTKNAGNEKVTLENNTAMSSTAPSNISNDFLAAQYEFNMKMIDGYIHRSSNPDAKIAFSTAVSRLFWQLATTANITKTLEIGAYEAGFSKNIKTARPEIDAIAFEANPFVYDHYKESVLGAGVDYRQACVNSTGEETSIRIPLDYRGTDRKLTNQMCSIMSNNSTVNTKEMLVPGVCLDKSMTLTEEDTIVAWIDVEGACGAVLPGCVETLKRCTAVYIEVESMPIWDGQWLAKDVGAFFAAQGFFPVVKDFQSANQYNVIYINSAFDMNLPVLRQLWNLIDDEGVFTAEQVNAA